MATQTGTAIPASTLAEAYAQVRAFTERLCEPLTPEDCVVQSMPDASPAKWHLAHTTWFFEQFVLVHAEKDYRPFDRQFGFLFNSYYDAVGERHPRPRRGLLTRPTLERVLAYRRHVDERMLAVLDASDHDGEAPCPSVIEIGLNHEQQHQELLLTDAKHLLSCNPLRPAYHTELESQCRGATSLQWHANEGGLREIGHHGEGFAYDNESPRHRVYLKPFELASRLVTCAEYIEFMDDGGYDRPDLWLSEGWASVQSEGWQAPLYWERRDGEWGVFTLGGLRPVDAAEPVCHVSLFEADAYARWADARLATEAEWESVASTGPAIGHFAEAGLFHPAACGIASPGDQPTQLFGDVWEWTASAYLAYPGYRPPPGALGEYNGKFMCNQYVLRGGSCATPGSHIRATYRNFFSPAARWQFSGIRLARDVDA